MTEASPAAAPSQAVDSPVIEVSHVSTRFGQAVVHDDVNLMVVRGEVFAIAGGTAAVSRRCCGKSSGCCVPAPGRSACSAGTAANWKPPTGARFIVGSG